MLKACLFLVINCTFTGEALGEFSTVMQTRDEVEGLHNCREFSQPLECLYQDMQTKEKSFLLLLKNNFQEKKSKTLLDRKSYLN